MTDGDNEETYLEGEYKAGEEEPVRASFGRDCLESENRRLRIARLASRRARSIVQKLEFNNEVELKTTPPHLQINYQPKVDCFFYNKNQEMGGGGGLVITHSLYIYAYIVCV